MYLTGLHPVFIFILTVAIYRLVSRQSIADKHRGTVKRNFLVDILAVVVLLVIVGILLIRLKLEGILVKGVEQRIAVIIFRSTYVGLRIHSLFIHRGVEVALSIIHIICSDAERTDIVVGLRHVEHRLRMPGIVECLVVSVHLQFSVHRHRVSLFVQRVGEVDGIALRYEVFAIKRIVRVVPGKLHLLKCIPQRRKHGRKLSSLRVSLDIGETAVVGCSAVRLAAYQWGLGSNVQAVLVLLHLIDAVILHGHGIEDGLSVVRIQTLERDEGLSDIVVAQTEAHVLFHFMQAAGYASREVNERRIVELQVAYRLFAEERGADALGIFRIASVAHEHVAFLTQLYIVSADRHAYAERSVA